MIDRFNDLWDPSTFAEAGSRATDQILDRQRRNTVALGRAHQQLMHSAQTMLRKHGRMLQETASEAAHRLQYGRANLDGTDWSQLPTAVGEALFQVHAKRLPEVVETATTAHLKAAEILFERVQADIDDLAAACVPHGPSGTTPADAAPSDRPGRKEEVQDRVANV